MDRDPIEQTPHSLRTTAGDPGVNAARIDDAADTEGHSFTEEYARTVIEERSRAIEHAPRDAARQREVRTKREGGLLGRLRRR